MRNRDDEFMDDATAELAKSVSLSTPGWTAVEAAAQAQMPSDHQAMVRRFGAGCFNGFLWLWVPGCPNEFLDMDREAPAQLEVLKICAERGGEVPAAALVDPPALTAWAGTDNGDTLWWLNDEGKVGDGQVLVSAVRPLEWEIFNMSCSRLLERFVAGALPSDILISGLGPRRFTPWHPVPN